MERRKFTREFKLEAVNSSTLHGLYLPPPVPILGKQ